MTKIRIFTCAICKRQCETDWTEEESLAELREQWGNIPVEDCDVICGPCNLIVQALRPFIEATIAQRKAAGDG